MTKATGSVTTTADGIHTVRVSLGAKRESFALPACNTPEAAASHALEVAAFAKRMAAAGTDREDAIAALKDLAAAPPATAKTVPTLLKNARHLCSDLVGGWKPEASELPTFLEVATQWWDGTLHAAHPKKVRKRRNCQAAKANLIRYVIPEIGHLPVDEITLEACNAIASKLGHLRDNSTRQVLAPLNTILDYCVSPLGHLDRSPLPPRWQPREGETRTLQYLYPSEVAKLLGCAAVPLWQRVLFGYLLCEGGREMEPVQVTIDQFDFEDDRNTARLYAHQTKTETARLWRLEDGTAHALKAWVSLRGAQPTDRMFVNAKGKKINAGDLPKLLRKACKLAGLTRRELFAETADSRWLVVHDLRRSYVTCKLAIGKSEAWIEARTGQETSEEMRKYKKAARTFEELNLGDMPAMAAAIPELTAVLAFAAQMPALPENTNNINVPQYSIVEPHPLSQPRETAKLLANQPAITPSVPASSHFAGDSLAAREALDRLLLARLEASKGHLMNTLCAHLSPALAAQVAGTIAEALTTPAVE